jgi:hypothetical protein
MAMHHMHALSYFVMDLASLAMRINQTKYLVIAYTIIKILHRVLVVYGLGVEHHNLVN